MSLQLGKITEKTKVLLVFLTVLAMLEALTLILRFINTLRWVLL